MLDEGMDFWLSELVGYDWEPGVPPPRNPNGCGVGGPYSGTHTCCCQIPGCDNLNHVCMCGNGWTL